MPHFFINSQNVKDNICVIDDNENYTHIAKSLRSKIGEKLLLIDENEVQYEAVISDIDKNSLTLNIQNSYKSERKLPYNIFFAISPLNSSSVNLIFEKLTELGVRGFYPIYTDNCAVKKDVIIKKIPKWQKICYEASKQCERADIPICYDLTDIESVIQDNFDKILCFTERESKYDLKEYLTANSFGKNQNILVIIGPEGGFSKREFQFFKENNTDTVSLGKLILKADTACIIAAGNIIYENTIN